MNDQDIKAQADMACTTATTSATPIAPCAVGGGSTTTLANEAELFTFGEEKKVSSPRRWAKPACARRRAASARLTDAPRNPCAPDATAGEQKITNDDEPVYLNSRDILRYVADRLDAANDYFKDSLYHITSYATSFQTDGRRGVAHPACVKTNIAILRKSLVDQGFTHPNQSLETVFKRYLQTRLRSEVTTKRCNSAPLRPCMAEYEDCIYAMRAVATDLVAGISRLYPNFSPMLERARITPDESKTPVMLLAGAGKYLEAGKCRISEDPRRQPN